MESFIKFFDEIMKRYPMHLAITYSKITDWRIHVYRKGTGENGEDEQVLSVQHCDVEYCFAKAQVLLKDWLSDNMGGY